MPDLPPPLPPGERNVGQYIAEVIRFDGSVFWKALPLGLPIAAANQGAIGHTILGQAPAYWAATPLFVVGYLWACHLVTGARATWTAAAVATLIYLPFPALRAVYILPGLAWFAFIGLAVPVAMVERTGFRESLIRGRRLGLVDFVYGFGVLAALVLVVGVSDETLQTLLHSQGDTAQRASLFLADLVLTPLLLLGGAMLYDDQKARQAKKEASSRQPRPRGARSR